MKIFCVYDSKAETYGTPFFMENKGVALRGFQDVANDSSTQICKYPEDFTLFELGSFDPLTAKFVLSSTPTSLGVAIEFKRVSPHVPLEISGNKVTKVG